MEFDPCARSGGVVAVAGRSDQGKRIRGDRSDDELAVGCRIAPNPLDLDLITVVEAMCSRGDDDGSSIGRIGDGIELDPRPRAVNVRTGTSAVAAIEPEPVYTSIRYRNREIPVGQAVALHMFDPDPVARAEAVVVGRNLYRLAAGRTRDRMELDPCARVVVHRQIQGGPG